jgi:hypothetical protein
LTRLAWSGLNRLPVLPDLAWNLRRNAWNALTTFKFQGNKPAGVPPPVPQERPVLPLPFSSEFPHIPIEGLVVADHVPEDEAQPAKRLFVQAQLGLSRLIPPMQPGLASIPADPNEALGQAYTRAHRRSFRFPVRPSEYAGGVDLGRLAVASPYACYLQAAGDGVFQWDLSGLGGYECHRGLRPPGAVVEFRVAPGDTGLEAVRIESDLGCVGPYDPQWVAAQQVALCAVTTHLSLVRHFNWIHLVAGARLAMTTRNLLPHDHPIRRLLWPHVYGTQYSNQVVTAAQLAPGGDFESVYSYTHRGLCGLFEQTVDDFDLRSIEPGVDAERRGVLAAGFPTPAIDNRRELVGVLRGHISRYLALYFDDDSLAADEPFGHWLAEMERGLPHGVRTLAGGDDVTLEGAAAVLSALVYLATVEHEIVGSGLWDYQLWSDVHPVRVYADGSRPPLDVYQRLVNANLILNAERTPLLGDFSHLALDEWGAAAFSRFHADLRSLQADLDRRPGGCWRMEPKSLKANINA